VRLLASAILVLTLASCGSSGGSGGGVAGGGTVAPGTGGSAAHGTSGASQAGWQTALAALGSGPAPTLPLTIEQPALDAWGDLVARTWPVIRARVDGEILGMLRTRAASLSAGSLKIQQLRNIVIDTAAPPGFLAAPAGNAQGFGLQVPRAPGTWRLSFTADVGWSVTTTIAGFPITALIAVDVTCEISDVRVESWVTLDVSNASRPVIGNAGAPMANLRLSFSSSNSLLSQITTPLTSILDPVIRFALIGGASYAQREIGAALAQVPVLPWGTGAAPAASVPGAPPLRQVADEISVEIQRNHLPFDTLVQANFDQPGYGNGQVAEWEGYGDSTIFTGHYVAAEAMRYDLTGDPHALAGAARAMRGIDACLEVAGQRGLLSRCVIPVASPHISSITSGWSYFVGSVGGVPTGSLEDISRDQYLGVFMAGVQSFLRVPQLRSQAQSQVSRMVDYLDGHDWNAYRVNGSVWSRATWSDFT
jgi:hypothetical protein